MLRTGIAILAHARAIWVDRRGQDMIEYALMASVVAVACGAILPPVTGDLGTIFSRVVSLFART
jgi:Flp pilus assembly pilin Flp